MSITVQDARLEVWHQDGPSATPGDGDPDAVITDGLDAVTIASRANDVLDEVKIDAEHPGRGRLDKYDLRLGDKIRFVAEVTISSTGNYGEDYGLFYGGTARTIEWAGRVQPVNRGRETARHATISADATDWPGGILAERTVTGAWVEEDVGQIIREVIEETASEVDASQVPDLGVTTDAFMQSRDAWEAVVSLAAKADVLLTQDDSQLVVEPIDELTRRFALGSNDYVLPVDVRTEDRVYNVIRVDSGVSRQLESSDEDQSSWERVTDSNRISTQIRARKSEIHSFDLYVRPQSDRGELNLRLQADEGGAPVAPNDENSDIVSDSIGVDRMPQSEGWVTFWIPEHTLPDRDPWVLIEGSSETGHDVGISATGAPTYRSYYGHPLNFEASHGESIEKYGARELRIERENLKTLAATRDAVNSELARRAFPMKTIAFEADSPRAHSLTPGDVIDVDIPEVTEVGEYIVTEAETSFDASTVQAKTDITAEWRKGILAPQ